MIKAVIFDCFGVLLSDNWAEFQQKYLVHRPVANRRAIELNRRSDLGLLSYDEWIAGMAVLTGLTESQVRAERHADHNVQLLAYINSFLKPRLATGIVSNVGRGYQTAVFRQWKGSLFDDIVLSYEFGDIKPHEAIYHIALERLGVTAGECIYVDDKKTNVDVAEQLGFKGIVYSDYQTFRREAEGYLSENPSNKITR